MKKHVALIAATLALSYQSIRAEESALSTTVTAAYNSRYMLYGYNNGRDLYSADAYLAYPLREQTSIWGGSWYGQIGNGSYEEVDLYGGIDQTVAGHCSVGFAYSMFHYIDTPFATNEVESEFAVHASYAGENCSLSLRHQYDTGAEGAITRIIGGASRAVTETVSLSASAEAGYAFEYYIPGNLWNHALLEIGAPVQLTPALNLTPSVSYSIPLAATDDFGDEETVGAISMALSF